MRLNLGCGNDLKPGYVNADVRKPTAVLPPGAEFVEVDLRKMPWPWAAQSADEVLMLDFLEHFEYRLTDNILTSVWRVLKDRGILEVQVPDFEECSRAILRSPPYNCNRCGWLFVQGGDSTQCPRCRQTGVEISQAAVARLYGGQDYAGNYHLTTFTIDLMIDHLKRCGFRVLGHVELNENGETFRQNWNFKLRAEKVADIWSWT